MVGSHQGFAAAMQRELFQHELAVEIHVVQVHDGKHSGVSASPVQMELNIDALKFVLQHSRYQPTRPFVEVPQQQAWVLQGWREEDFPAHQHMRLPAALQVSGAKVNVENMDALTVSNLQIAADAAAPLAA